MIATVTEASPISLTAPSAVSYLVMDNNNTTRMTVSAAGTASGGFATFYPYGEPGNSAVSAEYEWTNQIRGAGGVDHFPRRDYASQLGRWLSPDPAGLAAVSLSDPQSWDEYSYVLNNPASAVDPYGMDCSNGGCGFFMHNGELYYNDRLVSTGGVPWQLLDPSFRQYAPLNNLLPGAGPGPGAAGPSAANAPGRQPCAPSGTSPSPEYYAAAGAAVNALEHEPPGATFPPGETNLTGAIENADNLLSFHRGGALDAQVRYGGSQAYASYVFGDYMAAAGFSLKFTLAAANAYGEGFSTYRWGPRLTPDTHYTHIPATNVRNITAGFNAELQGDLCSPG